MADRRRIDVIARGLAAGLPRRPLLGAVVGALALAFAPHSASACKKAGKRCDKDKDCCDGARCKKGECACKGSREECDGQCVKLDRDEQHCGRCNRECDAGEKCTGGRCESVACQPDCDGKECGGDGCGGSCGECLPVETCNQGICGPRACTAGEDSCAGVESFSCGLGCRCYETVEGDPVCANSAAVPGLGACGQCETSGDCASFGEDAVCAKAGSSPICCGPDARNFCTLRCTG